MSRKLVRWSTEDKQLLRNAMVNKQQNQTDRSIFKACGKTMQRSTGSVSAYWYGHLSRTIHTEKRPKDKIVYKKQKYVWANERMYEVLTQDQKDFLLRELLGIV